MKDEYSCEIDTEEYDYCLRHRRLCRRDINLHECLFEDKNYKLFNSRMKEVIDKARKELYGKEITGDAS